MRYIQLAVLLLALTNVLSGSDWLTLPSTYTHDAARGKRVSQFTAIENPTTTTVPNFRTSGYTHTRSRLGFGGSIDNYHRVEEWGEPVRPYGEWQRPFRPGSVPYSLWGPPFGGLNQGPFGPFGGFNGNRNRFGGNRGPLGGYPGGRYPGGGHPGGGYPGGGHPGGGHPGGGHPGGGHPGGGHPGGGHPGGGHKAPLQSNPHGSIQGPHPIGM